jgi:hypothetical protein
MLEKRCVGTMVVMMTFCQLRGLIVLEIASSKAPNARPPNAVVFPAAR